MARPARFSDDDILDGAARAVVQHGRAVTVAKVAEQIDGPSGSIYHRFASREELLARLWLRSIQRFHVGLLAAYSIDDPRRAVRESARHVPVFCDQHPVDAVAMTLFRRSDLVADGPVSVRAQAEAVNDEINAAMAELVLRRYGQATDRRSELMATATRLAPYGMVRPHLGSEMPEWMGDAVAVTAEAITALGDARG